MKLWNRNICLTNRICMLFVVGVLFSTLMLASVWSEEELIKPIEPPIKQVEVVDSTAIWVPTKEDIAYQDSMYSIIEQTQLDIEEIKLDINGIIYKLDRLYYDDGSWDSIRYVDGGVIDNRIN